MTQQQRDALECEAGYVFTKMDRGEFNARYGKKPRCAYYDDDRQGAWAPPEAMPLWQAALVMAGVIGVGYMLHKAFEPER